jgi:triacylglycerol esterase/lipase EstA (alpha/beta hydrolase family)
MGQVRRILIAVLLLQGAVALGLWYVALAIWHIRAPDVALVLALLIVLLCRAAIAANNFVLSFYHRSPTPAPLRPTAPQRVALFVEELAATLVNSSWTLLSRAPRAWQAPAQPGPALPPVLMVHGYGGNGAYWTQLSARLVRAGISHDAIDLEPMTANIDDYAALIAGAVQALKQRGGAAQVIIVGHSMGGLAARAYMRQYGQADVARLITLGTPHHGTGLAAFGIGSNAAQMARRGRGEAGQPGAWLASLAAMEDAPRRALMTSIFSHHDNIVAPQTSSRLEGARNIELGGVGHVALGRARRVLDHVQREIELARAAAATGRQPRA